MSERKVRAAQGSPLPKIEAIGDGRTGQKRMTAPSGGKGEKVVQETTSRRATVGLCPLEAASSRIPSLRAARPKPWATTEGRTLEPAGDRRAR